jgi:hypothetical protein
MFNRHGLCFGFDRKDIFAMPFKTAPIEPGRAVLVAPRSKVKSISKKERGRRWHQGCPFKEAETSVRHRFLQLSDKPLTYPYLLKWGVSQNAQ